MRRFVFLLVLALSLLLLQACAKTNMISKDDPAVLTSGHSENPYTGSAARETVSPAVQSSSPEAADGSAKPSVLEQDASEAVSPQISLSETDNRSQDDTSTDTGDVEASSAPAESTTPDVSSAPEPVIETPQSSAVQQPPTLAKSVKAAGLSFDDLAFSQLVLVAAEGSNAMLYCYDKGDNGRWKLNVDIGYIKGYVGKNGISTAKLEGDNCTPAGLFQLGYAFGNKPKPSTGMVYKAITVDSYWVDDPNSIYYNQWVEGSDNADWSSAEHLSDNKTTYAYAVTVAYNMAPDTVAGKGSAIFLHIKHEPTSGCIAVSEEAILKILKWLNEDKNPNMLIAAQ